MKRFVVIFLGLLFISSVDADVLSSPPGFISGCCTAIASGQRGRAVRRPASPVTPADWVRQNSIVLAGTDLIESDDDLRPLLGWISGARVIGLGDGTHGTHEYYTVKKRLINFLAREEGINIVAFEAPWAEFNKISEFLLTGSGNPRELLRIGGYFFWEYQEMLDLVMWARAYNETRGDRPPLRFVGVDTLPFGSKSDVIAFIDQVDPAAASLVRGKYLWTTPIGPESLAGAKEVHQLLLDNRARYEALSSPGRVNDVIQSAYVVVEYLSGPELRDRYMAENLEWFLETQGKGARALFWGHNEHVGKTDYQSSQDPSESINTKSAGSFLQERFGDQYYVIGTCSLGGSFTAYERTTTGTSKLAARPMEPPTPENYESYFSLALLPRAILNLRTGPFPEWLKGPRLLQHGRAEFGATRNTCNVPVMILQKFDGIIYFESTTSTIPLP